MKQVKKPQIGRVRNKLNPEDVYYTYLGETKEIDGVKFIPVFRNIGVRDTIHWMKKDNMEFLK